MASPGGTTAPPSPGSRIPPATSSRCSNRSERPMIDHDVEQMSREQLADEVRRLRAGIREHRDSTGQELCWHHPKLWGLLPERSVPEPTVPEWPQFMRGCIAYRQSLDDQLPDATRSSSEHRTSDPKLVVLRFNEIGRAS